MRTRKWGPSPHHVPQLDHNLLLYALYLPHPVEILIQVLSHDLLASLAQVEVGDADNDYQMPCSRIWGV